MLEKQLLHQTPAFIPTETAAVPEHQPAPPWAVLGQDQAPWATQERGQDQEMDGVYGERIREAAVGRGGFLEGTSGGHQESQ